MFVNGLPVGLLELKNPGDENATLKGAWNQIQTYRTDIPVGLHAERGVRRLGRGQRGDGLVLGAASSTTRRGRRSTAARSSPDRPQLEVLVRGVFEPARFLDLLRNFVVFSDEPSGLVKRVAKYHQYWAVNAAVESTIEASSPDGDRRGGVVWHTQGSGKSFEMLCYAAKVMRAPEMGNPTLVLITDRNDLDDQLFGEVFAPARILPEEPRQATSPRRACASCSTRVSGGIIFTTIQKFAPEERGRRPPGADRPAQRGRDRRRGAPLAVRLPRRVRPAPARRAAERDLPRVHRHADRDRPTGRTRQVFGDYIDVYDLTRAVEDGATVRIFYESRLAKVRPAGRGRARDRRRRSTDDHRGPGADGGRAGEDALGAGRGDRRRRRAPRPDRGRHRRPLGEAPRRTCVGKAMIVGMSRRICVELYERIVALRPDWHDPTTRRKGGSRSS